MPSLEMRGLAAANVGGRRGVILRVCVPGREGRGRSTTARWLFGALPARGAGSGLLVNLPGLWWAVPGAAEGLRYVGPQLLPVLAFGVGEVGQGVRAAHAGEVPIAQPALHQLG